MKIGVLALQGAAARHLSMLARLGVDAAAVRVPDDLDRVDALVLPGGESTTMALLLDSSNLLEPLARRLSGGMPALGTCAGLILLAADVLDGRPDQHPLGAIDLVARRNAYGGQVESFEADLDVPALGGTGRGDGPFHAVFIRAPAVEKVGPDVEVLAAVDDRPVLCREGAVLVAAFHPELSDDPRVHDYFLSEVM